MDRDVIRLKLGQSFRLHPYPRFTPQRVPGFRFVMIWVLRHVSDAEAEFRNQQTGVAFRINLEDLEEIRIPDYLIIHCDITVTVEKATLVSRKQPDTELLRRVRRPEEIRKQ